MKNLLRAIAALALMAMPAHAQTYPSPTFNNVTAQGVLSLPNNPLALSSGGLGATTAAGGRATLGLGTAATQNTGTSGANVPLLNGANTWGADQSIVNPSGNAQLYLNSINGSASILRGQKSSVLRWQILLGDNSSETGSNTGSNFVVGRFNDAGSSIDSPLTINRANGQTTIANGLNMGTNAPITFSGTGAATTRSNLGAAASGANSDITSLSGLTTALSVAQGGTGGNTQATARTGLGLGSIATQAASSVAITGGSITGITDLAIADGGTGASDAATARTNLGLTAAATMNASTGGTFTPVLSFGGASTGITYTTQTGSYSRIGSLVFFRIVIALSSKGTATGAAVVSGLPIASATNGLAMSNVHANITGITYGVTTASSSTVQLFTSGAVAVTDTSFGATTQVNISGVYDVGAL